MPASYLLKSICCTLLFWYTGCPTALYNVALTFKLLAIVIISFVGLGNTVI